MRRPTPDVMPMHMSRTSLLASGPKRSSTFLKGGERRLCVYGKTGAGAIRAVVALPLWFPPPPPGVQV
ncbi:hypothetical protein EYF80_004457 [Liparis tanakae]|uniref:Uncharacterized protein n=1 Tax=Liparis tanakae TaxID=230148 RepID=A0A4Z2J4Y9_9TELE|nr:hypothetical protein EYF80_004457 [Liparis tanakae]